jgi:galacturan 1,4-alpha-galacturonidase
MCSLSITSAQTISLSKIKNADVSGIHLLNSKSFHIIMSFSDYVKMHGLKITAPGDSPNTDGIHVSTSSNVDIYGITVGTGDDCISIGHGSTQITISDVTCGPGHGIRYIYQLTVLHLLIFKT